MPDNITVTGKIGPAVTVTSLVFNNVTDIDFQLASSVLRITHDANVVTNIDLFGIATVTYSITTHVATVVVS